MEDVAHRSEVAGGGIARFSLTRFCCSQIRLIPDLFQTPFSEIKIWKPALLLIAQGTRRSLHSIPALILSGLSSRYQKIPRNGPSS